MTAQPLQPLPKFRNSPQTELRLKAQANGWSVVPCGGKSRLPKGWPKMKNDAVAIRDWDRTRGGLNFPGTGIRVEGEAFVIDLDISTPAVMRAVQAALLARWPAFFQGVLVRTSGAVKLALFGRIDKPIGALRTARYGDGELVEIFGSKTTRFFAISGPHSAGRDYRFESDAPWEVRLDELAAFPAAEAIELVNLCDRVLGEHLEKILHSEKADGDVEQRYDLKHDGSFILTDGTEIGLDDLVKQLKTTGEERGLLTRADWEASQRKDHCKAALGPHGLWIRDFQDGVTHRFESDAPPNPESVREALKLIQPAAPANDDERARKPPMPPDDPTHRSQEAFNAQVDWLLRCYGKAKRGAAVVDLYSTSVLTCSYTIEEIVFHYSHWYLEERGPRGGTTRTPAARVWGMHVNCVRLQDVQTRPDKPFQTFEENGLRFKNTYLAPLDTGWENGSVDELTAFLAHLLPDPAERARFTARMAHKFQFPWIPGPATLMIAADDDGPVYGTGRGTLFRIIGKIFGEQYVSQHGFGIVAGTNDQSRFDDWRIQDLWACVNESSEDNTKFHERRGVKEHLKEICDPQHREVTVNVKGKQRRRGYAIASLLIASNHSDAIMLDSNDRRFDVYSNGVPMNEEQRTRINAWMEIPANIAAARRFLARYDASAFDPYALPPITAARQAMIDETTSEVEITMRDAHARMRGVVFLRNQLEGLTHQMSASSQEAGTERWRIQFEAVFRRLCKRVTRENGERVRISVGGAQQQVYAWGRADALRFARKPSEWIYREVAKNDPKNALKNSLAHLRVVEKDED